MKKIVIILLFLSMLFSSVLLGSMTFELQNDTNEIEALIIEDFETLSVTHTDDFSDKRVKTCGRRRCTC